MYLKNSVFELVFETTAKIKLALMTFIKGILVFFSNADNSIKNLIK